MSAVSNAQPQFETILVTEAELPVFCPPATTPLWNMHPRVYIEIEKEGRASCPYCSATYQLAPENHPE